MSTAVETRTPSAPVARTRPHYRVTGPRVVRSEWAKFWTLRSTWITLGLGAVALVGFGAIAAARYRSMTGSGQQMDPDFADSTAVSLTLFGVMFAQLALAVLGVLFSAGEHTTGMIRSTLAAVPKRLPVLWSKALVQGIVALVVGAVGVFAGYLIANAIVSGTRAELALSASGVVRSLLGAALYLGLVAVLGVALGALLRSVAGGISVLVVVLMLAPGLLSLLPSSWRSDVTPYLPSNAGEAIYSLHQTTGLLSPGKGLAVLVGWVLLALAGAAYRLARTDA
jgi:hypothetical protein